MAIQQIKVQWRLIHKALHDKRVKCIRLGRTDYSIQTHENGCRYLDYDNIRFVQQNPAAGTDKGRRARRGERITWANTFNSEEQSFVMDQTLLFQPVENAGIALPMLQKKQEVPDEHRTDTVPAGTEQSEAQRKAG